MHIKDKKMIQVMVLGLGVILWALPAHADLKQIKTYKEAYPDSKPKCVECHAIEKPKKDDGQHELNDYGRAVKAAAAEPTVETYQKVGKIEDFKKAAK